MTEHFARQGDRGAEAVQEILNRCFGRMVDLILDFGGEVVKFAGDATLALWPVGDSAQLPLAVRRAGRCGLAIQEALDGLDGAGSGRLRLRLGIGAGEIWAACVGGLHGSWEALVGGAPLRDAAQAERRANPGEVLLSASAWALVQDDCQGIAADGCVRLLRAGDVPRPGSSAVEESHLSRPALAAFISPVVLRRLEAGQDGFLSEFRQVSVLFASIREADGSAPESLERLQAAARCFQEMVDRYGGSVNQLLVEDKGTTFVAGWGVPFHSHEDDAARSVLAAMEIHPALRGLGFAPAIGVAGGRVFTGTRGNAKRLEYALIGAKVNLSARLMQAAGEGILCDAAIRDAAARQVVFEELPLLSIKGKTGPVAVFRPLRRERADLKRRRERELIGRQEELRLLCEGLAALRSGAGGGVIVLEAEPGMGKSLLVSVLLDRAREASLRTFIAAAESLDRSTAYYPFREVFGQILGLSGELEAQRSLLSRLGPDSAARAPLLNSVLPFVLEEAPATLQMTPEARAEVSRHLLVDLFEQGTEGEPALLIVEDAHWLDTASWTFVEALRQQVKDLLLVIATRPMTEEEMTPEHRRLFTQPGVRRLQLGALRTGEAVALACRRLGVRTLPLPAADLIQSKPEGNPLFIEELALALRDRGLLRIEEGQARLSVEGEELVSTSFPATVQGAIASRIDRLSPGPQLTLKVASVFGRSFELRALRNIHPLSPGEEELRADLDALAALDLVEDGPGPDQPSCAFKHAVVQEVAYSLLPYAQRRPLHGSVAGWIERTFAGSPNVDPLLAHHWQQAGDARKAFGCFERAGERALANFANREAARLLNAALELDGDLSRSRRAQLKLMLGQAYARASNYDRAKVEIEEGLRLLGVPLPTGPAQAVAGVIAQVLRQAAYAVWPSRLRGRAAQPGRLLEAAAAYEGLVEIFYYTNRPLFSFYSALRGLDLAERAGSSSELARSYALAGAMAGYVPLHRVGEARCRQALEIARETGDPATLQWVSLVTGVFYTGIGRWTEARERYTEGIELAHRVGNERNGWDSLGNLGIVCYFQGDFGQAVSRLLEARGAADRRRDLRYMVLQRRAELYPRVAAGELEEAARLLEEVKELAEQGLSAERELTELDIAAFGGLLSLRRGDEGSALVEAERAAAVLARLSRNTSWYGSLIGCSAAAEVFLGLWKSAIRSGGRDPAHLRQRAGSTCRALRGYARIFPIAWPAAWLHQGTFEQLSGRPRRALKAWERSRLEAVRLGMPWFWERAEQQLKSDATIHHLSP